MKKYVLLLMAFFYVLPIIVSAETNVTSYNYSARCEIDGWIVDIEYPEDFEETKRGYAYLVGRSDNVSNSREASGKPKKVVIYLPFYELWIKLHSIRGSELNNSIIGIPSGIPGKLVSPSAHPGVIYYPGGFAVSKSRQENISRSAFLSNPIDDEMLASSANKRIQRRTPEINPDQDYTFDLRIICDNAFEGMTDLTEIDIPNTVVAIWSNAFKDCINLQKVTIPNSVEYVAWGAFSGCSMLSDISLSNKLKSIECLTFSGCTSLAQLTIPYSVTSIGWDAFENCGLENIALPNSLTKIDVLAFEGCKKLSSVVFSSSLKELPAGVFMGCELLKQFSLPNGLEIIGLGAFAYTGLEQITIPSSVKKIRDAAFDECNNLHTVNFSEGLDSIGINVFYRCVKLKTINLPNSLNLMGEACFAECEGLEKVYVSKSLGRLERLTFHYCSKLSDVEFSDDSRLEYIGPGCFSNCSSLREFDMPDMVKTLDEGVDGDPIFENTPIEQIKLSAALNSLPDLSIENTLTTISFGDNSKVTTIEESAFKDYKKLKQITLPDGLKIIGVNAFRDCENLEEIEFPEGLTTIDDHAFDGCNNLKKVSFPVTITRLGYLSFKCENLKDIYVYWTENPYVNKDIWVFAVGNDAKLHIPKGTIALYTEQPWAYIPLRIQEGGDTPDSNIINFEDSRIEQLCIKNWDSNKDGYLSKDEAAAVTTLGETFKCNSYITSFNELKYFTGLTEINDYAFEDCFNLQSIVIPCNVTTIGISAFSRCELSSISIPNSVTTIGYSAFGDCGMLSSVSIPNGVTTIKKNAFSGCSSLTSITIPSSINSISEYAFSFCSDLSSIIVESGNATYDSRNNCNAIITNYNSLIVGCKNTIIPSDVTSIGSGAFEGCINLISISIPNSVQYIGHSAFRDCGLTSIIIPNDVTAIGNYAFAWCSKLTSITIPRSITSIAAWAFQGCDKLTEVTSYCLEPSDISESVFEKSDHAFTDATLYVPVGTRSKYLAKEGWKKFKNIVEKEGLAPLDDLTLTANNYTRVYGDDNPSFEFTVSDGTITSGTPTITCLATKTSPVGTYPITVEQGTVTNMQVTYVAGTLTVTKAPLTITAKSYTIEEGKALPTFEATYSGWKNNETETVLTKQPIFACTATTASAPGTYDITVSGAEAKNYEMSYVKGTLTITKAIEPPVTITANNLTMVYGDNVPMLTYKSEGGEQKGTPYLSTTATKTSSVGTYPITVANGSVTNEKATFVNGTLTITKAPLTVTAGTYTKKQGEENPEFTLTYEGFKNNETEAVLTTKPTVTCAATADSEPGEYEVTVSGGEAQNYELSYVNGILTVTVVNGISELMNATNSDVYDTQGRKVSIDNKQHLQKGIYIVGGKKIVIK